MRISVGASAGGHMNQLLALLDCKEGKSFEINSFITTDSILNNKLKNYCDTVHIIGECNRRTMNKVPMSFFRAFIAVMKDRPEVVITTGALPLAIYARISKFFGARVIWIDSIANIEEISASGRWALSFADRVYTQWAHLVETDSKLLYRGCLI